MELRDFQTVTLKSPKGPYRPNGYTTSGFINAYVIRLD